jgi:hypothetical protein
LPGGPDEDVARQQKFDALAMQFPLAASSANFRQFPQARVYNNAALTITTGTTTALTFNSERWDLGTTTEQHSTSANTGRLTCQVPGLYAVTLLVNWASNATGARYAWITYNTGGATFAGNIGTDSRPPVNGDETRMIVTTEYRLAVGDYVECGVYQTSGGNLNVQSGASYSPEFMWHWVSP